MNFALQAPLARREFASKLFFTEMKFALQAPLARREFAGKLFVIGNSFGLAIFIVI